MEQLKGLSQEEVAQRLAKGQVNKEVKPKFKSNLRIVLENLLTYFNLIFAVVTALLIVSGNTALNNFTFLPIVIINAVAGIIQEIRAKKIVSKLAVITAPTAKVLRDGQLKEINITEIVLDDIIFFEAGQQIMIDAQVLTGNLQVNESILTGEADEIVKATSDDLMSGSFVVAGSGYARVTKVGKETYIAKLVTEAQQLDNSEQSEMIKSINGIVKWIGILLLPLAALMLYQSMAVNGSSFHLAVQSMVAAVIGMIPEGLYLLTTVSLVASTMRLAKRQVVLNDMKSVEKLARVDVLCIDKTGTITENHMEVQKYLATKEFETSSDAEHSIDDLLARVVADLDADNDTMIALKDYFKEQTGLSLTKRDVLPFKSSNKYSAVIYDGFSYLIGSPEILLGDQYATQEELISHYASQGYRVLLFGKLAGNQVEPLKEAVTPYALILISNPIRKDAPATFDYFAQQDVAIKVISGDNPITVSRVAQEAYIKGAEHYIDARELSSNDLAEAVNKYTVFGRVTPSMKQNLVRALQAQGHTVGMTGDGVNDVLALKEADCSVAMASGSEAATNVAQIVLLDNNFASMPHVVSEGRRTVNNIERSASLFLIKNLFSFAIAILSVLFLLNYPLKSAQISLISAFMIGIPGYLLTFEPNDKRIEGHFMVKVLQKSLPAVLATVVSIALLMLSEQLFELNRNEVSTVAIMIFAAIGFIALVHVIKPMNQKKVVMIAACVTGFILSALFFNKLFAISAVQFDIVLLGCLFFLVGESINRNLSLLTDFIAEKKWQRYKKWF